MAVALVLFLLDELAPNSDLFSCFNSDSGEIYPNALLTIAQPYSRVVLHNKGMVNQQKPSMAVPCPTCGAKPGEKCELNAGLSTTEAHRDRRLAAWDGEQSKPTPDRVKN